MYEKRKPVTRYSPKCGRIMRTNGRSTSIFWNPEMIATIRKYFAHTKNEELAGLLGVSLRTVVRKARELGLTKNKAWLQDVWDDNRQWAHIVSRRKGYPGTFKPGNEIGKEYRFKPKK